MKYTIYLLFGLLTFTHIALAQEEISEEEKAKKEEEKLQVTGSVDVYYKYDFSGYVNEDGTSNIPTSFADNQNSISIGMLDVGLSKQVGKASFVGEFSFGPRSFKSIPTFQINTDDQININIQNLYVSYALTEKLSVTAGYMGTFVGYEVISPVGNFNYSTSYLFSFGPFQNAGLKFDYAFSDNFALMAGVFNDWNVYQDFNGVSDLGAQMYWAPTDGWDIYVNFLTGSPSGTIIDLTTGYQITDKFYLGINAADYSYTGDTGGYYGVALYPQISLSDNFSLGWRPEFFTFKELTDEAGTTVSAAENVFANTITGNFYYGPLTISTEYRIDGASSDFFYDSETAPTNTAQQFLVAAIFAF
jgi:hypothetical protein